MDTKSEPNQDPLRDLLRECRARPPLASNFQDTVWRRIERAEAPVAASPSPFAWLERWIEVLLLPRFAFASLAVLLVVGGFTGMAAGTSASKEQALARYLSAVAPNTIR
jgi:hypothetical protein